MKQDGQYVIPVFIEKHITLSPGIALHYRVYRFQMGRIGRQLDKNILTIPGLDLRAESQMVLNIPVSHLKVRLYLPFKFIENVVVGFSQDIGQDVQAPPVGHTQHHFLHALVCAIIDHGIQRWDGILAPFEGKPLLTDVLGMQEVFKNRSLV
jgi:hypothetical protein